MERNSEIRDRADRDPEGRRAREPVEAVVGAALTCTGGATGDIERHLRPVGSGVELFNRPATKKQAAVECLHLELIGPTPVEG